MKSRELKWQGDGTAEQEQVSDVYPAAWPAQVTMPPHRRVHGHWTQLAPWATMNLPSLIRPLGPACMRAFWVLSGPQRLAPLCTLQLASLSPAIPDQEPCCTSSVYTRLVEQVMLLFCHFSSQTLLKCQDIRKLIKNRVFSPQPQRCTKAFTGPRFCRRPAAILLNGRVCF